MSKFRNTVTGVEVSVSDEKDSRFTDGWVRADTPVKAVSGEQKRDSGRSKKN